MQWGWGTYLVVALPIALIVVALVAIVVVVAVLVAVEVVVVVVVVQLWMLWLPFWVGWGDVACHVIDVGIYCPNLCKQRWVSSSAVKCIVVRDICFKLELPFLAISHSSVHYSISNIQYIWMKFKSSYSHVMVSRCQYLLWRAPSADYISQIRMFQARPLNAMNMIMQYTWTALQNLSLIQICSCLVMRQAKMRECLTDAGAGLCEARRVSRGNVLCRERGFQFSPLLHLTASSHMTSLKVPWQPKNLLIFCTSLWYLGNSIFRVCHGYNNTRSDRVTGSMGTGTVLDFDTPRHTVTHTSGIAGTHRYFITGWQHFYWFFLTVFLTISISWLCHTVTQPNMAVRGHTILPDPHHPSSPYK